MSTYTNYDIVCENYDTRRVPFGANILLQKIVRHTTKQTEHLHILDAGCGSGNYSLALLEMGVGKMSLFDASNGMLGRARDKLKAFIDDGRVVSIKQGLLPNLAFSDEMFDAVMLNCVLHHLDTPGEERIFPNTKRTIQEAFRVLKPGGLFTAICSYPDQIAGVWYTQLLPKKLDRYIRRFPDFEDLRSMTNDAGFSELGETRLFGTDYFKDYHNPEGPFSKSWRTSDSYWSQLDESEINALFGNLEKIKASGKVEDFVKQNDGSLTKGSLTIIAAGKL